MNFKRFHESKNLLEDVITEANIAANGSIAITPDYNIWVAKVTAGETYRANNVNGTYGFYTEKPTISSITYNNSRELFSGDSPTILVPQGISYIGIRATVAATNVMLNIGSEALPYEPYSSEVWHDIPHYIHKTDTDILTLPQTIYGDGTNATLTLKGNTEQNGTPTPQNPVTPNGTGERTENLWDGQSYKGYLTEDGTYKSPDNTTLSIIIKCEPNTQYAIKQVINQALAHKWRIAVFSALPVNNSQGTMLVDNHNLSESTITTRSDSEYIVVYYIYVGSPPSGVFMVNEGSEILPYEPYGYKIPILNNSQTYNKYLGEEQTVRQIKKLVFDGTENWNKYAQDSSRWLYYLSITKASVKNAICTHCQYSSSIPDYSTVGVQVSSSMASLLLNLGEIIGDNTIENFKSYLAAQYAAGTPVTVWYVLATEETAVVNEPLMKIGDYADSLTTTIPTTDGANSLSVDTTVQPSEVTANYHGWHPVQSVHERENGAWT